MHLTKISELRCGLLYIPHNKFQNTVFTTKVRTFLCREDVLSGHTFKEFWISHVKFYSNLKCHASQKQDMADESHGLVHQVSSESRASIAESLSEFFDAQEVLLSASSSEVEVGECQQRHRFPSLMFLMELFL